MSLFITLEPLTVVLGVDVKSMAYIITKAPHIIFLTLWYDSLEGEK